MYSFLTSTNCWPTKDSSVEQPWMVFGGVKDVKRGFTHACQMAGIEDFRFHDLRHTFASWLMQAGAALVEVRDLLGHASIEMTERYAHLAPERLRGAVARLDWA
ncbi:site-specific integrase [Candidatus Competibacter phosphatis]